MDSRKENFKLSKLCHNKVKVIDIITAPEIEILIICSEGKFQDYKNSHLKPSDYCKQRLRLKDVKSYKFVQNYFSDPIKLLKAIITYDEKRNHLKGEKTLSYLLNIKRD